MTTQAVDTTTGEVISLDRAAAERRAERIRLRLDSIADNYAAVMPMIRQAIEARDDLALGYRSPSEYVSDRFGGALIRLGVDVRREVVRELTAAGMSTRAIAPVVGVSQPMVVRDLASGDNPVITSETPAEHVEPALPPVVGIDGKAYSRPAQRTPNRRPLPDFARDAGWDLRKAVERLERIAEDDRFSANKEQVASHLRSHLTNAVEVCQDLLARIDN